MTAVQIAHFLILIGLGILSVITFLVAGTIVALMIVEASGCNCVQYPVGLYILGALGLLLLVSLIREIVEAPLFSGDWIATNQEALILTLLVILTILIIL